MNQILKIPYGPEELSFELPTKNIIIGSPKDVPSCNLENAINHALNNPIKIKKISQMVKKGKKVSLIIDDYTRPTPTKEILKVVLTELQKVGIDNNDISIIIAAGIHRKMHQDELTKKVGIDIINKYKIILHNSDNESELSFLGNSSKNTPIWINKEAINADVCIGIGLVEAHPYAGFCGGSKIMMPGIAGKKTIFSHHGRLAESINSWFGITDGNPFWEDLVEIAKIGKLKAVINVVINGSGEVSNVFFGEPVHTQKTAISKFIDIYGIGLDEPVDIVIASSNPKYWYFDQSNVAMLSAGSVVKQGGTRIIAAYCNENLGPEIIRRLYLESFSQVWSNPKEYLEEMKNGRFDYEMADAPAIYKLLQAEQKAHMVLISKGIEEEDANKMRLDWSRNIQEVINRIFKQYGNEASVLVLPYGSMSYTYLK